MAGNSDSDFQRLLEEQGAQPQPVPESEIARQWLNGDEIRRQLAALQRQGPSVPDEVPESRIARDFFQSSEYDALRDYLAQQRAEEAQRRSQARRVGGMLPAGHKSR